MEESQLGSIGAESQIPVIATSVSSQFSQIAQQVNKIKINKYC